MTPEDSRATAEKRGAKREPSGPALLPGVEELLADRARARPAPLIAAVGAGGKTATCWALARACAARGLAVVVTTTTRMARGPGLAQDLAQVRARVAPGSVVLAGTPVEPEAAPRPGGTAKFGPLRDAELDELTDLADLVIVEADGSRQLPLKAPAAHEPVVPPAADLLLVCAGLSALGRRWEQVCFRPELARPLVGEEAWGRPVDPPALARLVEAAYLRHPALAPWSSRRLMVLNQADDPQRLAGGRAVAAAVADVPSVCTAWGSPTPDEGAR